MATRRQRFDTAAGSIESAKNAMKGLPKPTEKLDAAELVQFRRLVSSKCIADLNETDLALATHLAKLLVLQDMAVEAIKRDGHLVPDQHGRTVSNPAVRNLDSFSKSVATLTRLLGLGAGQRHVGSDSQQKLRNKADRLTREALISASGDDEDSLI